ncbi:MAG: helix-turn-helix transcriptional regulator [Clostridiales bacterium]|nr:helix-turn-helix transcriptional regulator [Clostridiales bacterium]
MTLGEKISKLRKENNYTQEQLAEILGISRQAISKWESDVTYPETDKLLRMSDLFNCSLDYLLKNTIKSDTKTEDKQTNDANYFLRITLGERKSKKTICGLPLWHIGKNAKGIIAIGIKAKGIISIGLLSLGVISFGMLSLGLLSIGLFSLGILSFGCFSTGLFATGAISFGIISIGAIAIGDFSVGALSIGKYIGIGDNARGMIALGDTHAVGSLYEKIGDLSSSEIAKVKELLDTNVPTYLAWAKNIIKLFL